MSPGLPCSSGTSHTAQPWSLQVKHLCTFLPSNDVSRVSWAALLLCDITYHAPLIIASPALISAMCPGLLCSLAVSCVCQDMHSSEGRLTALEGPGWSLLHVFPSARLVAHRSLPCWLYMCVSCGLHWACMLLMQVKLPHQVATSCGVLHHHQHNHSLMCTYKAMPKSFKGTCKDWFDAAMLRGIVCC